MLICQRVRFASGVEDQALQRIAVLHSLNLIWWSSESAYQVRVAEWVQSCSVIDKAAPNSRVLAPKIPSVDIFSSHQNKLVSPC